MGCGENRPTVGLKRCTVRVVFDIFDVGRTRVEAVPHVLLRKLREGARLKAEVLHDLVNAFDSTCYQLSGVADCWDRKHTAYGFEHVVSECRTSVR